MKIKKNILIDNLLNIHWLMLVNVIILFIIGVSIQYSSSGGYWKPFAQHQIMIFLLFFPVMIFLSLMKTEFYLRFAYLAYIVLLFLLLTVNIAGFSVMGATRWIRIGIFNIQPSEIAKVALILVISRYFYYKSLRQVMRISTIIGGIFFVIPFVLSIIKQPNLGTASVIMFISIAIFFCAILNRFHLIIFGLLGLIIPPVMWNFLHDYQKKRIISFLHPEIDPLGIGYNTLQSQIAIGSGGIYGKGFIKGTQTQLNFLPEKQTDFVFTVFSEEWGFIGVLVFFFLYTTMVIMSCLIAMRATNYFCKLVAVGITTFFIIHFFINIGMVIGVLPVVGVPLPMLSYGGSITVTSMLCVGILLSIHLNSKLLQ